ncbi:band 4.1-like protein 2 isoform X10 [Chiloscyllium plagiosum]|uniref:band 4.1-like protein 2 isoform X10 n=1 Tax=Chiloscyllium plagiosum TaxID=36176 RepID=UPI001CB83F80|nr:band 4.1-like protein 2 isoform X10 [Chiloscyllium plagiosum]
MTTKGGSLTEVKEEPEQIEEDHFEASDSQEPVNVNQEQENDVKDDGQPESIEQPLKEQEINSPAPNASAQASPSGSERKEQTAGKGLSRFLPGWLKKQKSLSPLETTEDKESEKDIPQAEDMHPVEEEQPEPVCTSSELEVKKEEKVDEETKIEERVEQLSVNSGELQPVEEEKIVESLEKDAGMNNADLITEDKKEESNKGEDPQKAEDTSKRSPLKIPKKIKVVQSKVLMLDGSESSYEIEKRAKGQVLFDKVCEQINLLERDYFGLTFRDAADEKNWLDPAKEIKKQIRNCPWQFSFNVKFYPPDPSQLTEDITRYYLCLQLRQDIVSGRLPCSFVTHALLGSCTLQAELGDYDADEHKTDYVSELQFAPRQTKELEEKICELHKTHRGLTPAQADAQFLENAKMLSMYGVDLHHAKDSEGVDIMLGICANGLLIYKDRLRINRFAWPKILKISYKRSNFYIKIRPGETEQFESTIGFKLPNHRAAKRLWKVCVEHHTFFRLLSPEQTPKSKFLTLGSKFRYSGRTQAQTREASTLIDRPAPYFERTSSKRLSRSLDGGPVDGINEVGLLQDSSSLDVPQSSTAEVTATKVGVIKVGATDEKIEVKSKTTPSKESQLEMPMEMKNKSLSIEGENIYIRHSNLMLEDLDKTQEDLLKHQASISELKRSFMESTPEPRPNEWENRLTKPLSLQTEGSLEEEITSLLLSKESFSPGLMTSFSSAISQASEGDGFKEKAAAESVSLICSKQLSEDHVSRAEGSPAGAGDIGKSSDEKQKSETEEQAEVVVEETKVIEEVKRAPSHSKVKLEKAVESSTVVPASKVSSKEGHASSSDSHSESEEEAEYHPQIKEGENIKREKNEFKTFTTVGMESKVSVTEFDKVRFPMVHKMQDVLEESLQELQNGELQEAKQKQEDTRPKLNGDVSYVDSDAVPQVVCCSEPPVVKTEMVTISDTVSPDKTEIATKEVPIVQTETKTITYEAAQGDGSGDNDPGVLMSAQTITSESICTTMTTQITKTVKGGVSETRIEKRIVITGDTDIDHDQALAQAIKEAKEQHPDMSVTRVVVHKETELTEDGDE